VVEVERAAQTVVSLPGQEPAVVPVPRRETTLVAEPESLAALIDVLETDAKMAMVPRAQRKVSVPSPQ